MDEKFISDYRKLLEGIVSKQCEGKKNIAVALSGGIDSAHLLFTLLSLGKSVRTYSLHREGVVSTDYRLSEKNSEILNIPFTEVILPNKLDIKRLVHIMKDHKLKNKAAVECTYTMDFVWEAMQKDGIDCAFSGVGQDNYFGTTKKASIHYSQTLELNQQFRKMSFDHFDYDNTGVWGMGKQPTVWTDLAAERGIKLVAPAYDRTIYEFFYSVPWKEMNTPKQKYPCWAIYPDYVKKCSLEKHSDLQCGDTQIRELFEPLLKDPSINTKGRTRMLDMFRDWQDRLCGPEDVKINKKYSHIIEED